MNIRLARGRRALQATGISLVVFVLFIPCLILVNYALADPVQVESTINQISGVNGQGTIFIRAFDLREFVRVTTGSSKLAGAFLNSFLYSAGIAAGQMILAFPAAVSLALLRVKGRAFVLSLYLILMLMPFQVTVVPSYLTLHALGLLNHPMGLLLPQWFIPFSAVLLYLFLVRIPHAFIEAGKMDGANWWRLVWHIVVPLTKSGIGSIALIQIIDSWNMIEQPVFFLTDMQLMPLSILIRQSIEVQPGEAFVPSLVFLVPVLIAYSIFYEQIIQGMQAIFKDGRKRDG
ncbi:carbohydrate ABC transporter permease [Cohnella hashimotonis]|uniref:Carbohydrate ABC transporter permease n=1 Tax=Cohnella hashimotonis TaxID=2826895 RepID=A0ABT6TNN1_9BACL|nr:carbohydrate ABC transporter permease [Cohnella hashimotonis]MDI4647858.1 carbohydrate ABC transporter permease [Cohnella hashimotonis]